MHRFGEGWCARTRRRSETDAPAATERPAPHRTQHQGLGPGNRAICMVRANPPTTHPSSPVRHSPLRCLLYIYLDEAEGCAGSRGGRRVPVAAASGPCRSHCFGGCGGVAAAVAAAAAAVTVGSIIRARTAEWHGGGFRFARTAHARV